MVLDACVSISIVSFLGIEKQSEGSCTWGLLQANWYFAIFRFFSACPHSQHIMGEFNHASKLSTTVSHLADLPVYRAGSDSTQNRITNNHHQSFRLRLRGFASTTRAFSVTLKQRLFPGTFLIFEESNSKITTK